MQSLVPNAANFAILTREIREIARPADAQASVPLIPFGMPNPYGQKQHFTPEQLQTLARHLEATKQFRNLTLLCLGVDTMLRCGDLLGLRVKDICDGRGRLLDQFFWHQKKSTRSIELTVLPYSQTAVNCWIATQGLKQEDFLFPSRFGPHKQLSDSQFCRIVKGWADFFGLNPSHYACHSLRRTKPAFMHDASVSPRNLQFLLGHKSLQSTQEYLGLDRKGALALTRQFDIFNHEVER